MEWKEFINEVYGELEANDSFIEKVLWKDKQRLELEAIVLEGGYEPCRRKFWVQDGEVRGGYR